MVYKARDDSVGLLGEQTFDSPLPIALVGILARFIHGIALHLCGHADGI